MAQVRSSHRRNRCPSNIFFSHCLTSSEGVYAARAAERNARRSALGGARPRSSIPSPPLLLALLPHTIRTLHTRRRRRRRRRRWRRWRVRLLSTGGETRRGTRASRS
jgi:hypothetical protein